MRRRVVVTGVGVVAPNGIGKTEFWDANVTGKSGIDYIDTIDTVRTRVRIAARVKNFTVFGGIPEKLGKQIDRFVHLGLAASAEAIDDSGLDVSKVDKERIGVIVGSGHGGVLFHEEQMAAAIMNGQRAHPISVARTTPNAVAAHIAIQSGFLGPNYVVSSACASGNHALGAALRSIQYDEADVVVSGGVEAPLTQFTFEAFAALRVLSTASRPPWEASRPFEKSRDGFVMSEGAGILILEERERAIARNARIYAEITGYGQTSGAYHMIMPEPEGTDAVRTMKLALEDARLGPSEVDYINAHGTGTRPNDVAETRAIRTVFGKSADKLAISSTKSMIGHPLGASAAIEAVVCCLAIKKGIIPPTINLDEPDPECDLDYVPNLARTSEINVALSNAFGFGSVNACLIFQKPY